MKRTLLLLLLSPALFYLWLLTGEEREGRPAGQRHLLDGHLFH